MKCEICGTEVTTLVKCNCCTSQVCALCTRKLGVLTVCTECIRYAYESTGAPVNWVEVPAGAEAKDCEIMFFDKQWVCCVVNTTEGLPRPIYVKPEDLAKATGLTAKEQMETMKANIFYVEVKEEEKSDA